MRIILLKKLGLGLVGLGIIVSLSACGPSKNPLEKAEPKEAATFLVRASQYAEQRLHQFHAPGGYQYGRCMLHKAKAIDCEALYRDMLVYAKQSLMFKQLSLANLTDDVMYRHLKEDYLREQFNAV